MLMVDSGFPCHLKAGKSEFLKRKIEPWGFSDCWVPCIWSRIDLLLPAPVQWKYF